MGVRWTILVASLFRTDGYYVCVNNPGRDPRAVAFWMRGTLHHYGSENSFHFQSAVAPCTKSKAPEGVVHLTFVERSGASGGCPPNSLCVVVGDAKCKFDPNWDDNHMVIARQ